MSSIGIAVTVAFLPVPAWSASCEVPRKTDCAIMEDGFFDSELSIPENRAKIFAECSRERARRLHCAAITSGRVRFENLREVVLSDEILNDAASLMHRDAQARRFASEARRIARDVHGSPFAAGDDWLAGMVNFDEPQQPTPVPWALAAVGMLSVFIIVLRLRRRRSAARATTNAN